MTYELREACEPFATPADMGCDCEDLTDGEKEELLAQASDILVAMSGYRYRGICTESFRPRGPSGGCNCVHAAACSCGSLSGFTLPDYIASDSVGDPMIEVTIDGDPFDAWTLIDGNFLVRTDGRAWPSCANPAIPATDPGSFVVTVTYGESSLLARNAAVEIACLFVKQSPDRDRGLPTRARAATAQGVTIQFDEVDRMIKSKLFVTPWTIRFLTIHAPEGRDAVFVYSPEIDDGFELHLA